MSRDEDVFAEACSLPEAERAAFLSRACADDVALRSNVEKLLAGYAEAERMFLAPVGGRESPRPEEKPGDKLGRYKLLQKVGEGGCGSVWMAAQEEPVRRRVALKVIKLGMDTKEVIARFDAERQALALMDHPNIAKIFDAGATDAGRPFFVMELVTGIPITRFCDNASLTTEQRLRLFIQVCQAIQHAHQKGIIHRDIKPSNILVALYDGGAVPKVIDFGIAKATQGRLTEHTLVTAFEQFIGTPAYMSPEQVEYNALDVDTRSDVYSLGVVLYELLTGRPPFDPQALVAGGLDHIRSMIREVDPPRPSTRLDTLTEAERTTLARQRGLAPTQLSTHLRGDLDWIAMRCLEKDRTRRYETANGLANDIQRHLDDEAVLARPPSAAYRFRKAFRRNRLIFSAATAVAAALVAGLGVSLWQTFEARKAQRQTEVAREGETHQRIAAESAQKSAETEQRRADAQASKASESEQYSRRLLYASDMNLAQQTLLRDNLGHARRLLDRHRPQAGEQDLRGWEWRYLWQLSRSNALVTLAHRPTTRGWSVSFSPDGTRLAVGWLDGGVDLWDVPGRKLIRSLTTRGYPQHRGHVAFSPVGNLLAASSEPRVITRYDLDSGRESVLWRASSAAAWRVCDLAFSPDGSRLLIYAKLPGARYDEVTVVNVSTAQIESVHKTDFAPSEYGFLGGARLSRDNRRLYFTRLNSVTCRDLATGEDIWANEPEKDAFGIPTLALSPDGRTLALSFGYEDTTVRILDAATGQPLVRLPGHTGWVCQVVFSQDGRQLLSAATDQTIRIWDTGNWMETTVLRGHTNEVHAVAISEPAQLIASAGKDGNLVLWRVDAKNLTGDFRRLLGDLETSGVRPMDQSHVLLLPEGKPPEWVDLKHDRRPGLLPNIKSSADVLGVGWFAPNVLCHWDGTGRILVQELHGTEFILRAAIAPRSGIRPTWVAYDAAHQILAWNEGVAPASIYVESLAAPGQRLELKRPIPVSDAGRKSNEPETLFFQFSMDGKYLVVARAPAVLQIWEVETSRLVASINGHTGPSFVGPGGRVLAAVTVKGSGHELGFYDLTRAASALRTVPGNFLTHSLALSPDGGLLAINSDNQVWFFDPTNGESVGAPLHGHLSPAYGVAFSPDGRRLISSAKGREAIKLWDVGTRQELLTLAGTGSILWKARWSADGDAILAGPPWQAWTVPSWEEIAAAEAKEKMEHRPAGR